MLNRKSEQPQGVQTLELLASLRAILGALSHRRRMQLLLLLVLMVVAALSEMLTLGALVPFLAILTDPDQALQRPLVVKVVSILKLQDAEQVRWYLTLFFALTAAIAGVVRFLLIFATAKLNYGIGHELGAEVYRRTLYQPYSVQVARNSSEIMGGIHKIDIVATLVFSVLNASSAALMAVFIVTALLFIDPVVATVALGGFGSIYLAVSLFTRNRLARNGEVINATYNARVQSMQEGLGGIRDVLLDQTQQFFANRFNIVDWPLRQAQASNNIIGPSPRFAVEGLGIMLIAFLGYYMTLGSGGVTAAIPTLGALALGAQRLMPLLQQVYQGWVFAAGNQRVLVEVVGLLQQTLNWDPGSEIAALPFEKEIQLKVVGFKYQPDLPLVLNGLNLVIKKGARMGFVGATGSGKSTAMDLLMGLLTPTTGELFVDGVPIVGGAQLAWQRNVAHVPQSIFLADASFAENIAFGVRPELIDQARIQSAAERAQIAGYIEASSEGYATMVGERGVRLSGGQRQRIGIARALYKRATVLVFDEATSALDTETEDAVMQAISGLSADLTILIIAHRLSTLRNCTQVVEMSGGAIKRVGSFREIISEESGL